MSIQLIVVLIVLMFVNQIIGTGYGSWKEGFKIALFCAGIKKVFLLFLGYGALALASHYASEYVPSAEYISGILIEPIARYFIKICESLRHIINEPAKQDLKNHL